jgi:protein-L-isoaspartate O-methyltransferase
MKQSPLAKKLPRWAEIDGIIAPPSISMEQCSSEKAALYKREVIQRLFPQGGNEMTDLTGGFGVDFSTLALTFKHGTYVEQNEDLCRIARHNFPLLGVKAVDVVNGVAEEILPTLPPQD